LKDYLEPQLGEIPYFRALLRAVEARFYQEIELPRPVLDLGCGDGHFASQAFDNRLDVGLDPWWGPIKEASGRDVYRQLVCANGGGMPFPVAYFSSAVSNSVLEHIPISPLCFLCAQPPFSGHPFDSELAEGDQTPRAGKGLPAVLQPHLAPLPLRFHSTMGRQVSQAWIRAHRLLGLFSSRSLARPGMGPFVRDPFLGE
jgi:SAM-dependent methyltransferase